MFKFCLRHGADPVDFESLLSGYPLSEGENIGIPHDQRPAPGIELLLAESLDGNFGPYSGGITHGDSNDRF